MALRLGVFAFAFAFALAGGPARARAAVVLPLSVEDLARRADAVVRGVAADTQAVRSADGKQIFTVTTVQVDLALKGAPPLELEVLTPGGTVGHLTQSVAGAPRFVPGEKVILFLRSLGEGRFRVDGMALGKFEVVSSSGTRTLVRRRAEGLSVVGPDGVVRPAPVVEPVPEEDFLERVRAALREEGP